MHPKNSIAIELTVLFKIIVLLHENDYKAFLKKCWNVINYSYENFILIIYPRDTGYYWIISKVFAIGEQKHFFETVLPEFSSIIYRIAVPFHCTERFKMDNIFPSLIRILKHII